jgi:manganese efflux pump family protein
MKGRWTARSLPLCSPPSGDQVTELLLVAVALGISNLAASVGIGVSGVRPGVRARVALVFGLFEAGMPVLGVIAGHGASSALGGAARLTGGLLLAVVGGYQVYAALRERAAGGAGAGADPPPSAAGREDPGAAPASAAPAGGDAWGGGWRLLVSGFALSLDNLVVGFALGAYHVGLVTAALVIGLVSVGMSLLGLEAGARLGATFGRLGTLIGGGILAVVGIAIAAGWF